VVAVVQRLHAMMQDIKMHLLIPERLVLVVTATTIVLDGHMLARHDDSLSCASVSAGFHLQSGFCKPQDIVSSYQEFCLQILSLEFEVTLFQTNSLKN